MIYNQKLLNNLTFNLYESCEKAKAFNCCDAFTFCNVSCSEKISLGGTIFSNLNGNIYLNSTTLQSHKYRTIILLNNNPSLRNNVVKATNIYCGFNTKIVENRINFNISRLYLGLCNSRNKTFDELNRFLYITPINNYMNKSFLTGITKSDSSIKVYCICRLHVNFGDFIINSDSGDFSGKSINYYNFTFCSAYTYSKESLSINNIDFKYCGVIFNEIYSILLCNAFKISLRNNLTSVWEFTKFIIGNSKCEYVQETKYIHEFRLNVPKNRLLILNQTQIVIKLFSFLEFDFIINSYNCFNYSNFIFKFNINKYCNNYVLNKLYSIKVSKFQNITLNMVHDLENMSIAITLMFYSNICNYNLLGGNY